MTKGGIEREKGDEKAFERKGPILFAGVLIGRNIRGGARASAPQKNLMPFHGERIEGRDREGARRDLKNRFGATGSKRRRAMKVKFSRKKEKGVKGVKKGKASLLRGTRCYLTTRNT